MTLLKLENLTKVYSRGQREFNAVDHVDFSMEEGDFTIIIGKSGSGKSTLINMLVGLIEPSSGEVIFEDTSFWKQDDATRSKLRNQKIGFLPQGISALPNLTVLENILLAYFIYNKEGDAYGRAMAYLKMFSIEHLANEYPKNLSGGELRRMLLARAMINRPKLLVVDEPTGDLDQIHTKDVMDIFKKLHEEGVSILMISHELDTLSYADHVYTMKSGHLSKGNTLLSNVE